MSLEDKEIDALFRNAKAPEAPEFQESFWTEMEAMLPAQQKRRKGAFWWITGASAAILVFTAAWWLGSPANETQRLASGNVEAAAPAGTLPARKNSENAGSPAEAISSAGTNAQDALNTANSGTRAADHGPEDEVPAGAPGEQAGPTPDTEMQVADQPLNAPGQEELPHVGNLPLASLNPQTVDVPSPVSRLAIPQRPERFYLQAAAGIGQSALRDVKGRPDVLHYYALGGGLYRRVDAMYLSFGIQGRIDFAQNIVHAGTLVGNSRTDTRYAQLYSIETPLAIGFRNDKNSFGLTIVPGIQSGYTGRFTEYNDSNQILRRGRAGGKVEESKTLTMEIGLNYMRTLRPRWYLGCSINVDAVSPYGSGSFYGKNRMLPLNGSVMLRRSF